MTKAHLNAAATILAALLVAVAATAQAPRFEDVTEAAGVVDWTPSFGAVFADVDNDGDDDLLVSRHGASPVLYLNLGGARFINASNLLVPTSGDRHGLLAVDLDNDGDRDLVLVGGGADGVGRGNINFTMRNRLADTGKLRFDDVTGASGLAEPSEFRSRAMLPFAAAGGRSVDLYLVGKRRQGLTNLLFGASDPGTLHYRPVVDDGLSQAFSSEGMDVFVDLDRDGAQDLLIVNDSRLRVLRNLGGRFVPWPTVLEKVRRVTTVAVGDLDNNGFPDVLVGTRSVETGSDHVISAAGRIHFLVAGGGGADTQDHFTLRENGGAVEVDLTFKHGLVADDPSMVFVGAEARNPPSAHFTVDRAGAAGAPSATAPGLYLWFDAANATWHVVCRYQGEATYRGSIVADRITDVTMLDGERVEPVPTSDRLFANHGGVLEPWPGAPSLGHTGETAAAVLVDLDNNGHVDVVLARRGEAGAHNGQPLILANRGTGFDEQADNDLVSSDDDLYAADQLIAGLVNDDGLPDLFTTNGWGLRPGNEGPFKLFRNVTPQAGHSLILDLVGRQSNRDAIGAQVELFEEAADGRRLGYREIGGFNRSQSSRLLHFGLGAHDAPVRVEVRWPSGIRETLLLAVDQRHTLTEPPVGPRRSGARVQP